MAGREAYLAGLEMLADDDVDGALEQLSKAIEEEPANVDYLAKRSAVHAKRRDWAASLSDAQTALKNDGAHVQAGLRCGIALFEQESFADARAAFRNALQHCSSDSDKRTSETLKTWLRKCTAELGDEDNAEATRATTEETAEPSPPQAAPKASPFPFDWYQSFTHVTIEIEAKGLTEDRVKHEITSSSVAVDIALESSDSTFSYDWDLFAEIDPAQSSLKVLSKKLEIKLRKADPEQQWPSLQAAAGGQTHMTSASAADAAEQNKQQLPGPYAGGRNWDAIGKELEKEEQSEKPEGDEALNKLFRDIYKNASEDTRRAMVKSFQTSGGTVLSTNWDEVAKKDYETDRPAPKGMEWRSWEGDKLDVDKSSDRYSDDD